MNYSFLHLNERGITQRSEFLAMECDAAALDHARLGTPRAAFIVEVWRGDTLLSRILRDAAPT